MNNKQNPVCWLFQRSNQEIWTQVQVGYHGDVQKTSGSHKLLKVFFSFFFLISVLDLEMNKILSIV